MDVQRIGVIVAEFDNGWWVEIWGYGNASRILLHRRLLTDSGWGACVMSS